MTGRDVKKRRNAREEFRLRTDAEAVAEELEAAQRIITNALRRLQREHEAELRAMVPPSPESIEEETLRLLGGLKGQLYLARATAGLAVTDITAGTGWGEHTLRQFENRNSDGLVSSLVRYAAGLRAAGVKGRIEMRWVPEPQVEEGNNRDEHAA